MEGTCPSCGYCPHCKRGGQYVVPYWQWIPQPQHPYPTWTVTSGGITATSATFNPL